MARICKRLPTITLNTINRTNDPELLDFLNMVRDNQPDRESLFEFFLDRRWKCGDYDSLLAAVREGLELEKAIGEPFVWPCVTNDGAKRICMAALALLGLGDHIDNGFPTDPNKGESMFFYAFRLKPRMRMPTS